jgi:hypothetical protein
LRLAHTISIKIQSEVTALRRVDHPNGFSEDHTDGATEIDQGLRES